MSTTASDRPTAASSQVPSRSAVLLKWARLVLAVVIVVLLVAFIVDNSEKVRVGFVFFHAHVHLIWVLLITAVLGALLDRLIPRIRARQARGGSRK
jgi:uncharacterized integral membrane protein